MSDYRVAIALALTSNHNRVLSALSEQMLGVHAGVKELEGGFNRLKWAIRGMLGAGASIGVVTVLAKVAEHGKELLNQQAQMVNLGISQNEVLSIQKGYYDNIAKAVPTSTAAEYLKTVKELRAVTGSTEAAAKAAQRP